ncbi:MAG: glucan biosynthesis protein, partial [Rubrimonas sp.]
MIPWALDRRRFLLATAAAAAAPGFASAGGAFGMSDVEAIAEARAREPHVDALTNPSGPFADLDHHGYRALRYRPERRIWAGEGLGFTVEPLAPGHVFRNAVTIYVVEGGQPRPIPFDSGAFELEGDEAADGLAWSGARIRSSFGGPDADQDAAIFQGASYFRAAGRNQRIGLAARAVAVGTGGPSGEEFPAFTALWLHRPDPGADTMTIHALLEGPSLTGAYELRLRPGAETAVEVRASLFPRLDLENVGFAPLTAMFVHGPAAPTSREDWRPAVHG